MFKSLIGLALSAASVTADIHDVPCQSLTTSGGAVFDITAIESDTHYSYDLSSTYNL